MEKSFQFQYLGLKFLAASIFSLGLIFAWASMVALGTLKVGQGNEPTIYYVSVTIVVSLCVAAFSCFMAGIYYRK